MYRVRVCKRSSRSPAFEKKPIFLSSIFFSDFLILNMGVEMNFTIIKKKCEAEQQIGFPKIDYKAVLIHESHPTAWELIFFNLTKLKWRYTIKI